MRENNRFPHFSTHKPNVRRNIYMRTLSVKARKTLYKSLKYKVKKWKYHSSLQGYARESVKMRRFGGLGFRKMHGMIFSNNHF